MECSPKLRRAAAGSAFLLLRLPASGGFRRPCGVSSARTVERSVPMRRVLAALALAVVLVGCREVRVNQQRSGTTPTVGPREVVVVRYHRTLDAIGVAGSLDFGKDFAVLLLSGPRKETAFAQGVAGMRAKHERVPIVSFQSAPLGCCGP